MTTIGKQQGGEHYNQMELQPWQAFESWMTLEQHQGYLLGDAIAYLARFNSTAPGKGGITDVKKAIHCLQRMVEISEPQVVANMAPKKESGMWAICEGEKVTHYYPADEKNPGGVYMSYALCNHRHGNFSTRVRYPGLATPPKCPSCEKLAPQT